MADKELLTEDDDLPEDQAGGEVVEIEEEAPTKGAAKKDNVAAQQVRADTAAVEDGEEIEIVPADERKRLSTSERNKRRKQAMERDKERMAFLEREVQRLSQQSTQKFSEIETNSRKRDLSSVESRIAAVKARMAEAKELMGLAVTKSDGESHVAATSIYDEARDELSALERAKADLTTERKAPSGGDEEFVRVVQQNVKRFQARNEWFDPNGTDEDTKAVKRIDAQVAADGFSPATAAYWQELERRLSAEGFGDEAEDEERPARRNAPQQRRTPPNANSRGGGARPASRGGNKVFVSQERIDAMKEGGIWEDPERRNKQIKAYQKYDRENQAAN